MPKQCKGCKKLIYILQINDGSWKAFEDAFGSTRHECEQFEQARKTTEQRFVELEEKMQIDHNLLVKMISKINNNTR